MIANTAAASILSQATSSAANSEAVSNAASSVASAASSVTVAATKISTNAGDILNTYLIKALDKTGNLIDKSVDMVMEQAPILVQEVLHWYFAYSLIQFIVGVTLMIGVTVYWYKQFKWGTAQGRMPKSEQSKWFWDTDASAVRYLFNLILAIPFIAGSILFNFQWLKIWIAPRLWLIEYTTSLIKNHNG